MRRVLFVDDEPKILDGLENLLFPYMNEWDMEFCSGGEEALTICAAHPIDVLVTDMRMPKMDGATLLSRIKKEFPNVVRIVLSGHSELEAALRAMPIAHQFLSKPCDGEDLVQVLERACNLHALIDDGLVRSVLGDITQLPARPRIYSQLSGIMAKEDWSLGDVAETIQQDIGICTKILHIANTAFFSRGCAIKDLTQAVSRIGAVYIRELVLAFEVFDLPGDGFCTDVDIDLLHRSGLLTGVLARGIVRDKRKGEDAFLAGLVHDIGRLVLANFLPDKARKISERVRETGQAIEVAESELFGVTHAEIGAYLLGLWGMPYSVIEAVANHHAPARVPQTEFGVLGAVYVSNILIDSVLSKKAEIEFDMDYLNRMDVCDQLESWKEKARDLVELEDE